MITNPDYEPIFDNIIDINHRVIKIKEDQETRQPKLDRHTQQNFNAVADSRKQCKYSPSNACKQ